MKSGLYQQQELSQCLSNHFMSQRKSLDQHRCFHQNAVEFVKECLINTKTELIFTSISRYFEQQVELTPLVSLKHFFIELHCAAQAICNRCVNMLVGSKFQQSTNGIQNKWPWTYCTLRGPISKYIPIKILKNDKICESTAVLTVKICITNTVHVHRRDSDYQTRMEAVQICTDTYIHKYVYTSMNS